MESFGKFLGHGIHCDRLLPGDQNRDTVRFSLRRQWESIEIHINSKTIFILFWPLECSGRAPNAAAEQPGAYVILETSCGPVAQLGARFHGMEEVKGSNPFRSTNPRSS